MNGRIPDWREPHVCTEPVAPANVPLLHVILLLLIFAVILSMPIWIW